MALLDFLMVNATFKMYTKQLKNGDVNVHLGNAIKKLQYMDMLSQKLSHICLLNQFLLDSETNIQTEEINDQAGFIFKVNYCQSVVAANEFKANAEGLQQHLHALREAASAASGLSFSGESYMKNNDSIAEGLHSISQILSEMHLLRFREAPAKLNFTNELNGISANIYTMASERFVLFWLMKHTNGNVAELFSEYLDNEYGVSEGEIDMFE